MTDAENQAAEVIAQHIAETSIIPRDVPDAPDGTHDFDLETEKGTIALEVTSLTDAVVRSFWAAVGDRQWKESGLKQSWGLVVPARHRVEKLRRYAPEQLRCLEDYGITKFETTRGSALWPECGFRTIPDTHSD
jgi:hypothetical protein